MVTPEEAEQAIRAASNALGGITAAAEKFADEYFDCGLFAVAAGWNDVCGKKLGGLAVGSVSRAVADDLDLYACRAELERIASDLMPVIAAVAAAKKELS